VYTLATWETTATVKALFNSFNQRFPHRAKTSDGTIGDAAHSTTTSGHLPDDNYPLPAGGRAEYNDSDGRHEVRAADVDKDLNDSVTMQQVCDAIRNDPDDRARLAYMIYNRRIASASTSPAWEWRPYSGSSAHTEHAHFSSKSSADTDASLFESILNIGGSPVTDAEMEELIERLLAWQITSQGFPNGAINVRDLLKQTYNTRIIAESAVTSIAAVKVALDGLIGNAFTDADAAALRQEMFDAEEQTRADIQAASEAAATRDQQIMTLIDQAGTGGATAEEVLQRIADLISPA
jgi:hypothetical protein